MGDRMGYSRVRSSDVAAHSSTRALDLEREYFEPKQRWIPTELLLR